MTGAYFDAYADDYVESVERSIAFSGADHDLFVRRKARHLLELTDRLIGDRATVRALDLGCGTGLTDRYLAGRVGALTGVDVSEESVRHAAQRNPSVTYRSYDGHRLPFPDESFDLAFAICVVHHVPPSQWEHFASEMRRVLRPGGVAAVYEHNPLNPLSQLVVSRCDFDEDAVLLSRGRTTRLLASAGLSPVERPYILFFPSDRPGVRSLEHKIAWLPAASQYCVAARR